MMRSLLSLSPEIQAMIFSCWESYSDAHNALFICRKLYPEAERTLYRILILDEDLDAKAVQGALTQLVERNHIARYVKVLLLSPSLNRDGFWEGIPIPWPALFRSLINLNFLTIGHPIHLSYLALHLSSRLRSFLVPDEAVVGTDGITALTTFLRAQPELKRFALESNLVFPPEFASSCETFLPQLTYFQGADRLGHQLVPGRRLRHVQLYKTDESTHLGPVSGGEQLLSLTIEDIDMLNWFPGAHCHLRYLQCVVEWPFSLPILSRLRDMISLNELTFILPLTDDEDLPPFNYNIDPFSPILTTVLEDLPSVQKIQFVELDDRDDLTGQALLRLRDGVEPKIVDWEGDLWIEDIFDAARG